MKKLVRKSFISGLVFFMIFSYISKACTIVVKADSETILVGNNEDYYEPGTKVWFFPGSVGSYGRIIWGFDRHLYPFQGGMNDKGLFIDINAIGNTGWKDDPQKPNLPDDYIEYILSHCATIDDVVNLFQKFDIDLGWIKLVLADAKGESAIFEFLNGELNIIERNGDYQVSTNYLSPKEHTEPRNQIASKILQSQKKPTVDLVRKALAANTYDIYFGQTLYSVICDLKSKKIYLYHFHYFEEVVTFDLGIELQKGETSYKIPSLFKIKTQNEHFFDRLNTKLGAKDLSIIIDKEGIEEAVKQFYKMKDKKISFYVYDFPEWRFRSLGLNYLSKNRIKDAIGVFKINTEIYPESKQVYSDLADAYVKDKNIDLAIRNYQKVLKLSPNDGKTILKLRKLEVNR